jgi:hypothetical protein
MENLKWICWPLKMHLAMHFSYPLVSYVHRPAESTVQKYWYLNFYIQGNFQYHRVSKRFYDVDCLLVFTVPFHLFQSKFSLLWLLASKHGISVHKNYELGLVKYAYTVCVCVCVYVCVCVCVCVYFISFSSRTYCEVWDRVNTMQSAAMFSSHSVDENYGKSCKANYLSNDTHSNKTK